MSDTTWQIISMIIYFLVMIGIGLWAYRQTSDVDDYMLGGRQLNPMVAALSAGASDMSGWLLMGLPGALYASGLFEFWIAVGLTVGAWLNWKFIAPRLRSYTEVSNNSITVPSFLDSRLRDSTHALRIVAGLIILSYFTFYVSSGMVAGGTFFEGAFGVDYKLGMLIIAAITVFYTLVGGFLAVSYTDAVQGFLMMLALVLVPAIGIFYVGGFDSMVESVRAVDPALLDPLKGATAIGLISTVAWGLGYFGQPHIIVRFMALRNPKEAKSARRIGIGWMLLAVVGALLTALVGIAAYKHDVNMLANPEQVFIVLGQMLFHPLIAGFMLAAILAAIMSTISSQLLVSSSALIEDVYMTFTNRKLSAKAGVMLSRISVAGIAVLAGGLALNPNDTILGLVAFAWAGFGASFGPTIILALYWRKLTGFGALAGMVMGAITVAVWGNVDGGMFDLYEIVPGFVINFIVTIIVSLLTYEPNPIIEKEFETAVELTKDWSRRDQAKAEVREVTRSNPDGYEPRSATLVAEDGSEIELPK
ncbi:sodium/proline symporter PutP [Trueperella pecoris]|uniref:Sodium/proline symporter n=1 Tax=Trueperella pecoris TaxID=2733571 RepID=A0A7M1QTX7_9ACTO|nr:sodium/proline symporter PutP [Trueperella pecoris]QOR45316.1 sodium/proline symporter PutP [Trueperella pecoris]QTG75192.1 sodium/proline symporter PutP [Trueperella pecoris]